MNSPPILDLHPVNWNQLVDHNPVLCFCAIVGTCFIAWIAMEGSYRLLMRSARCLLVLARGWPPVHLNADGDSRSITTEPKTTNTPNNTDT